MPDEVRLLPREVHGPGNTPQPPKLPPGVGQGGVRSGQDRKGGSGQQGKQAPEPEPDESEEGEEEGHLDADSFARLRRGNAKDFMTETRMPWEVAADERRAKLAEVRKGKGAATGPLSAARAQQQSPKGLPGRQSLSAQPPGPAPKAPPRPAGAGRQIDVSWDADAAVSATFNAYQQLEKKQTEGDRPDAAPAGAPALDGVAERSGPSLNRDAIAQARTTQEPEAADVAAPTGPSWLLDPADVAPAPKAPARPEPGAHSMFATGKPAAPEARPAPAKRQTGTLAGASLSGAAKPAPAPAPPATERPRLSRAPLVSGASPEPLAAPEAPMPAAEPVARAPVPAPVEPVAAPVEPEVEIFDEAPEAVLEELLAEEPMLQEIIAQVPVARGPKVTCRYRVVDGGNQKALTNARLEFEPVQDDRLPIVNGQVDFEGWYRGENIPPGVYRVTVRAPGFIPHAQTQVLRANEIDECVIALQRP